LMFVRDYSRATANSHFTETGEITSAFPAF
jgi:hypothetical protein